MMMRQAIRVAGLILCLVVVFGAPAQVKPDPGGWGGAKWGMTIDAVKRVFPGKLKRDETSRDECWNLVGVQISERPFTVAFCFSDYSDDPAYARVIAGRGLRLGLISFTVENGLTDQMPVMRDLHGVLVSSYGRPTDTTDESQGTLKIIRERWLKATSEIHLEIWVLGDARSAHLYYYARGSSPL